jgi:HTH-type transcriptional regulator / antitoxin HigA
MKKNAYPIQPIRTEADYQQALRLVAPYFDNEPEPDSDAGAHFEAMVTLIEAYEAKHFPIAPPDPVQAIKFRMEQQGLTAADLVPMIGQRNRVYEVLNGKRKLTMAMVWKLHTGLGIPAESLIRQPG